MLTRLNFYGFSEVSFSSFAIRIRPATRNPRLAPSTKHTRPTHTTILIPPSIIFHILPYFRCHFAAFCVEDRDLLAAFFFWAASLAGPRHRVRPHTRHIASVCSSCTQDGSSSTLAASFRRAGYSLPIISPAPHIFVKSHRSFLRLAHPRPDCYTLYGSKPQINRRAPPAEKGVVCHV